MVIDDQLKGIIEERLVSGAYRSFGALYNDLFAEGLYLSSRTFFSIEVKQARPKVPEGFGEKKKSLIRVSSTNSLGNRVEDTERTSKELTEGKKDALRKAMDVPMCCKDIAYFLDVDTHVVHNRYNGLRRYRDNKRKRFEVGKVGYKKNLESLFYRHASQIYVGIVAGLNPQEIKQSVKISQEAYTYLLENRSRIEPAIITALQKMYDCPTHNVPYVTPELRQHLKAA